MDTQADTSLSVAMNNEDMQIELLTCREISAGRLTLAPGYVEYN